MIELRNYQDAIATQASIKLKTNGWCYLAMQCRTGKSLTAIASAHRFGAKTILVVTTKKAMTSFQSDLNLFCNGKELFERVEFINYESIHKFIGSSFDLVIFDEAHKLGAYPRPGKHTRDAKVVVGNARCLYLSGTPSPESYSQLYHQLWVCKYSPWKEYSNFYKWAKAGFVETKQVMRNGYLINDYSFATYKMIYATCSRMFESYTQEQAGFEASVIEHTLICPMTSETEYLIEGLKEDRVVSWRNITDIVGDTPATLLLKLHQLSSGTVIPEEGTKLIIDDSKAKFIKEHFKGQKIAIFYYFKSEFDMLTKEFPNYTQSPEEFQASNDKVFIAQIRTAREGVRLDTADALVFFNIEFSYTSYEQSRNRLSSKERTTPANVYFICSDCGIEKDILEAVHSKVDYTASYYFRHLNRK